MHEPLILLPMPRFLTLTGGAHTLLENRLVLLETPEPQALLFSAMRFIRALKKDQELHWELSASPVVPASQVELILRLAPERFPHPEGYALTINSDLITIEAGTPAGVFYGVTTLIQILERCGSELPCLAISDWPDFPARGVMLDISRDKVPTLETIKMLVDRLAGWKVNQLQLYTEHTFAYRQHPEVWKTATPFTAQDILELDAYCRERFIELVPNQNSFGHLKRWLVHPQYASLAEMPEEFVAPWGKERGPFSLCPTDSGSLELIYSLYDELLPNFSSRMFNVGCDETFDLGQGRSKEECQQRGAGKVYLDYLLSIYQDLKRRGYMMQFWADILQNYPELIFELPKDVIALEWGYEANHPFEERTARLQDAGIPFYVCPGTSSWNSLAGRTWNALENLLGAAESGLRHGAIGYLNTDWGDNGHWQVLPVSYLGFAAGAGYSWCLEANRDLDIERALSYYAFEDRSGIMGTIAYELGDLYRLSGFELINTGPLFLLLQWPLSRIKASQQLLDIPLARILEAVEKIMLPVKLNQMQIPDRGLVLKEYDLSARLIKHACWRGYLAHEDNQENADRLRLRMDADLQDLMCDYEAIWLQRNRSGGLVDSLAYFERARKDYL
jgi:hypothetical protein